jgi:hypothetical protein
MKCLRVLSLLAVVVCLLSSSAVRAGAVKQAKKKCRHHGISGTVIGVHHNKEEKGVGTIKVQLSHHKPKKQQAQAKVAKNALAQPKKKKPHTVTVHVNPKTKFAYVFKALVGGQPQLKTVGKGKNKSVVAVPGKVKTATRKTPAAFRSVLKGQHVHVKLGGHHHAKEVDIFPQKSQAAKQQKK